MEHWILEIRRRRDPSDVLDVVDRYWFCGHRQRHRSERLPTVWGEVEADLERFLAFLDEASTVG